MRRRCMQPGRTSPRLGRWRRYLPVGGILFCFRIRNIAVAVGGVESGDNREFAVYTDGNDLPKAVEELSTYPHRPWITVEFAGRVGRARRSLRSSSTPPRIIPISPTRCPRIIPIVGELSTEMGRLSPCVVESNVLHSTSPLVKRRRTYYASARGRDDQNSDEQLSTAPVVHKSWGRSG